MSDQWYPFFPGDFARDTSDLSVVEECIYRRLLDCYYSTGGPLPANASRLHRICRAFAEDEQVALELILSRFFENTPDGYRNKKADEIIAKRAEVSKKRSFAAFRRHYGDASASANAYPNAHAKQAAKDMLPQPEPYNKEDINKGAGAGDKDSFQIPFEEIRLAFNKFCPSLPQASLMHGSVRALKIKTIWLKYQNHEGGPLRFLDSLFKRAESSDTITNRDGRWRGIPCSLDWLLEEKNYIRVIEGVYDNDKQRRGNSERAAETAQPAEVFDEDPLTREFLAHGGGS